MEGHRKCTVVGLIISMEERLGGERSACCRPACPSPAGLRTLAGSSELIGCHGCHDNHIYHAVWHKQKVGRKLLRSGEDERAQWSEKQQLVINQVVKRVNGPSTRAKRWADDKWEKLSPSELIFMARCLSQIAFDETAGWTTPFLPLLLLLLLRQIRERRLIAEFIAPIWGEYPFNEVKCLEGKGSFSARAACDIISQPQLNTAPRPRRHSCRWSP